MKVIFLFLHLLGCLCSVLSEDVERAAAQDAGQDSDNIQTIYVEIRQDDLLTVMKKVFPPAFWFTADDYIIELPPVSVGEGKVSIDPPRLRVKGKRQLVHGPAFPLNVGMIASRGGTLIVQPQNVTVQPAHFLVDIPPFYSPELGRKIDLGKFHFQPPQIVATPPKLRLVAVMAAKAKMPPALANHKRGYGYFRDKKWYSNSGEVLCDFRKFGRGSIYFFAGVILLIFNPIAFIMLAIFVIPVNMTFVQQTLNLVSGIFHGIEQSQF